MASDPQTTSQPEGPTAPDSVEMPRPTAAPLVLALGLALLAAGVPFGLAFLVVGAVVVVTGVSLWIAQLLPGRGHVQEPLAEPARPRRPVTAAPGRVERLREGMPGYRLRLPQDVHPISAGIKGGVVGGLVMPVPALLWGLLSGHGLFYPINLLAGMVLPGVGKMTVPELEQFHGSLLLAAIVIHPVVSVVFGLIYGVLLPTLPSVPRPVAWGGLLAPLLWTGTSYALMGLVNPVLARGVSWPWFIASQFVFGIAAAVVVMRYDRLRPAVAGLCGGIVGGLLMPIPALLWGLLSRHGLWYPVNLLAGLVLPDLGQRPPAEWEQFHADWLAAALVVHAFLSAGFGMLLGLVQGKLPAIPGPVAWGGLVLPLVWTGVSYGLMGVVNPVLQGRVDWAWFVVSQFVFGVAAAVVVLRSELVHIPPAGRPGSGGRLRGRRRRGSAVNKLRGKKWRLLPLLAVLAAGCDLPGKPRRPEPADEAAQFNGLYATHCAGCHGADGKLGPAPPLNDPLFLAIVPDAELLRVIGEGRAVTLAQKSPMPAFARDKGGPLTPQQVEAVAKGIKARWGGAPPKEMPPPYLAPKETGDKGRGAKVFALACAACHGDEGHGAEQAGAINDRAFLSLISDQALRRVVITGRPDLGMPAYSVSDRRSPEFKPLTSEHINDLVALLACWRQGGSGNDKGGTER